MAGKNNFHKKIDKYLDSKKKELNVHFSKHKEQIPNVRDKSSKPKR